MAIITITNRQIQDFIKEKKILPKGFNPSLKDRNVSNQSHNHFDCEIIGEYGNTYRIIIRQSKINPLDFSVIFGIILSGRVFRIRRYNGDAHPHSNKIEKETIDGFHIHQATERYQELGSREEYYAQKTTEYSDLNSALSTMLKENNFHHFVDIKQKRLM